MCYVTKENGQYIVYQEKNKNTNLTDRSTLKITNGNVKFVDYK